MHQISVPYSAGGSQALGVASAEQRLLAAMLRDLGASREQAYAIGDSTNDLPMFEAARHTAALGDGMPELQAKAEYITAPVLENGLEQALKHWKLI